MYDYYEEQDVTLAIDVFKGLDKKTPAEHGGIDICQNWRFNEKGHLTRRPTYAKYNATAISAGKPVNYLERIYIGGNKYLVAACGTEVMVGNDAAGTFSSLKVVTDQLFFTGETYKDFHYLGNGVDDNIKTDGTSGNTDVHGCTAMSVIPSAVMSATVATCALDSALYKYKFAWEYDDYQQSSVSALTSATAETSVSCIALSAFESAPINATGVKFYRTEGGGAIYYYLASATAGAISSAPYYDILADSALDVTVTAPTDNGLPPDTKYLKLHKERIFLAGDDDNESRVYYSKISGIVSYPDIYPSDNWIPIRPDDGDKITGLAVDPTGYLCIFKKNSLVKIFTDGPTGDWSVSEPFTKWGCWAPYTIKETPGGIIYLAKDGWRIFDGQNSKLLSNSDKVVNLVTKEISLPRFDKAVSHYHNHLCYLAYTDRDSEVTFNNRVLIYDTLTDNFIIDNKNIASFATLQGEDDWGEIYYGDSVDGFVYKENITITELLYNKQSQFTEEGTLANAVAYHGENDPYLELGGHFTLDRLTGSSLDTLSPSALDDYPSAYSISGTYISPETWIQASNLYYLYWNELLGAYGDAQVAVRHSTTSAGLSGSWGSEQSNPFGSDISGETAEDWIQFRITLSSFGVSASNQSATPRLYVDDGYLFRLTYGVAGSAAETAIDCDWRGGYTKLNKDNTYTRVRKIEIDHDGSGGLLSCIWDLDYENVSGIFCVDLADNPKYYTSPFPTTAMGRKIRPRFRYNNINDLTIKAVRVLVAPQPERYQ